MKPNNLKNYLGEFFKEKAQKFAIEIEAIKTENQNLQQDAESCKNETQKYQNDNQNLKNEIEILQNEIAIHEQEAEKFNNQIRNLEQEATKSAIELESFETATANLRQEAERNANETQNLKSQIEHLREEFQNFQNCSINQLETTSLKPRGNIIISLIRQTEDAQEIDICAGLSTVLGYFTAKLCCQADQKYLFDSKTYDNLTFDENSIWIEDNICFINTTEISKTSVPSLKVEGKQTCSVDVFDEGEFNEQHFDLEINHCFNSSCSLTIDGNAVANGTILNGTSVLCRQSNQFGIITKSKFSEILSFCQS